MKKSLLLIPLSLVVVIAIASGATASRPVAAKCECTCPTLDQLLKEKEAADKETQAELGRVRRQFFRDKFSSWPLP